MSKGTLYKVSIKSNTNVWCLLGFHKGNEDLAQPLLNIFSSWCLTLWKKRIHISLSCLTGKALQRYYHESYFFFSLIISGCFYFRELGKWESIVCIYTCGTEFTKMVKLLIKHTEERKVIHFKRRVRTGKKRAAKKDQFSYQTEVTDWRMNIQNYSWRAA